MPTSTQDTTEFNQNVMFRQVRESADAMWRGYARRGHTSDTATLAVIEVYRQAKVTPFLLGYVTNYVMQLRQGTREQHHG